MGMRTNRETIDYWQRMIDEQETSGLSMKAYGQKIGKSCYQLRYWKRRLRESRAIIPIPPPGFIEVTPPRSCRIAENVVDIRVGAATIAFAAATDDRLFRRALVSVAAVLGGMEGNR